MPTHALGDVSTTRLPKDKLVIKEKKSHNLLRNVPHVESAVTPTELDV